MAAIIVRNVAKDFKVYNDKSMSLKEKILFRNRSRYERRQVLNNVSFEIGKGEAVGIVGENGCGKSTLLKIMTQIMYPSKGSIEIKGRTSSLIELGAGFHPDMSGRENIYTNAAIFGLSRSEIDKRIEQIIDFSEIREFIDIPVRTYSSGMYMRLAFSVAINVDADVLLVDEILAVGDANFQAKCFNKMREIKLKGTTIVIVSHSLGQIEKLCDRSIWIDKGIVRKEGSPFDVHLEYLNYMGKKSQIEEQTPIVLKEEKMNDNEVRDNEATDIETIDIETTDVETTNDETTDVEMKNINDEIKDTESRHGNRDVEIVSVLILDENGKSINIIETGKTMSIEICYKVHKAVKNPVIGVGFFRNDGLHCYGTNTFIDRIIIPEMKKDGVARFHIENNSLLEGEYLLDAAICTENGFAYDYRRSVLKFKMYSAISDVGTNRIEHEWIIGDK